MPDLVCQKIDFTIIERKKVIPEHILILFEPNIVVYLVLHAYKQVIFFRNLWMILILGM